MAPHPRVAVVVLIADAGTIDPATNITARRVPSKTHKALFVIVEKRIFSLLFASLAVVPTPLLARKHHGAFFFIAIGTLTMILSSGGLLKDNPREACVTSRPREAQSRSKDHQRTHVLRRKYAESSPSM